MRSPWNRSIRSSARTSAPCSRRKSITFSLTVKAIGDVAARLTALALQGKRFDITLQEKTGDDWSFESVVLRDCMITSATPTSASPTGAPTATFSGFSMHAVTEGKDKRQGGDPVRG